MSKSANPGSVLPITIDSASGGTGEGLGMGASNRVEVPVFLVDLEVCSGEVSAKASGGVGDGFGMGASQANPGATPWDCAFRSKAFELPKVVTVKPSGEKDRIAPCEFIPRTANASVITDKVLLISY